MQPTSPHVPSWIFLALIPLIAWIRRRRALRAAQASDFWFEPEGDHFIYHPFGRFGAAYLVSPAMRIAIRARARMATQAAALILIVATAGPIMLLSLDLPLYLQWRPMIAPMRLALILTVIAGSLLWRTLAVRPIYAGAPLAPRRISTASIHSKQAASRAWWSLLLPGSLLIVLAFGAATAAYRTGSQRYMLYAALLGVLALLNIRAITIKWRYRRLQQP